MERQGDGLNSKRIVVCNEGAYLHSGTFVLDGALEPAKDYLTVLSPLGEAGRSLGLASRMERDDEGALSFLITLEPYLNHDNFEFSVYITGVEYEDDVKPEQGQPFFRAIGKGTIMAVIGRHIRYIPKETPE